MSGEMYNRIVDTLNRQQEARRSLTFSAYYLKRETTQNTKQYWFEVLRFEVTESVAKS
jgi:hypothetical protein